jgi:hypothetical protein
LQLTLGRVVECVGDHVRLLDDLPNGATLAQEIVASSIFSVTEILVIKDHKLDSTFLHVGFKSQSLLKPTDDHLFSQLPITLGCLKLNHSQPVANWQVGKVAFSTLEGVGNW